MTGIRIVGLLIVVAAVVLLVGCPPKQPASQTDTPPVADPAKAAGHASRGPATEAQPPAAETAEAPAGEAEQDVAKLFEAKCAKCHPVSEATERTDTPEGWKDTVKKMQAKDTAWISDQEADSIAAYLAEKYPKK